MKSKKECFCALCRNKRTLRYERFLRPRHYGQIIALTVLVSILAFPWVQWNGVFTLPVIWIAFEFVHKSLYRKELRCPYCGFDPTWYKKDVKMARQKVEEFLKQNPDSPVVLRAQKFAEISKDHQQ